jgi:hypothetical protein
MNPRYDLDVKVACPADECRAAIGAPCHGEKIVRAGMVHFGRRVLAIAKEKNIILHPRLLDHVGGDETP